jgi:hypothetical protein
MDQMPRLFMKIPIAPPCAAPFIIFSSPVQLLMLNFISVMMKQASGSFFGVQSADPPIIYLSFPEEHIPT